jgi:manganese/zinc/iron transport system ATP- binding protein
MDPSAKSSAAAPPPIEVHDLTVAYQVRPVLWDVDLTLPEGKLIAVVGPNGAGKTTLLKAILGLVPISAGWVRIYGKPYAEQRLQVAYVPQRTSVDWDFPTSALDVVLMGTYGRLGWLRRPGRRERSLAHLCMEKVGIADLAHRQISQLSGGQQQRVFLARALAQDASIYLMDEPSSTCFGNCAMRGEPSSRSITICKPCPSTLTGSSCSTFAWWRLGRWRRSSRRATCTAPTAAS